MNWTQFMVDLFKSKDVDELLSAYLDGELTPRQAKQLEERLAREPELRLRLDGLRQTVMALQSLPTLEVPRHFILSPAMVAEPKPQLKRRPAWRLNLALSWATALAALLLVVVLVGDLWLLGPTGSRPAVPLAGPTHTGEAVALGPTLAAETLERGVTQEATSSSERLEGEVVEQATSSSERLEGEVVEQATSSPEIVTEPLPAQEPGVAGVTGPPVESPGVQPEEMPAAEAEPGVQMAPPVLTTPPPTMTFETVPAGVVTSSAQVMQGGEKPDVQEEPVEVPAELARATVTAAESPLSEPSPPATSEPTAVAVSGVTMEPSPSPEPAALAQVAAVPEVSQEPGDEGGATERAARVEETESNRPWLRVVEIGLGLLVLLLLAATVLVRCRGV